MQSSAHRQSAQLEVRVQPKAKRNALEAVEGQVLKAYVTAPPEGGKANEAVVALLAKALGLAKGRVTIVRGHRGRNKLVRIRRADRRRYLSTVGQRPKSPFPPAG